jgi:carbamoyltransferase
MIILGLNAHHADASACIVVDGKLVAAGEEERFRRVKHWAGFPSAAIKYCLDEAGVSINEVDHIAVNRDPNARLLQRMKFILAKRPSVAAIKRRLENRAKIKDLRTEIVEAFKLDHLEPKLHHVEHHRAHLASAFFVAPFEEAAVLSIDGFGDFVSSMGRRPRQHRVLGEVCFRIRGHLLHRDDAAWLSALRRRIQGQRAPYGKPVFMDAMRTSCT